MSDFLMPSLGADMESGVVVEWLVKPGDSVRKGDIAVETQKGAIDVEIFEEGVVSELAARSGDTVRVGGLLARLRAEGETPARRPSNEVHMLWSRTYGEPRARLTFRVWRLPSSPSIGKPPFHLREFRGIRRTILD